MNDVVRVVIVNDPSLFRAGMAEPVRNDADFEVVRQGLSQAEANQLAQNLFPNLVTPNTGMPGNSVTDIQTISIQGPVSNIFFLIISDTGNNLVKEPASGTRAYLLNGAAGQELAGGQAGIHSDESYLPSALAANLPLEIPGPKPAPNSQHDLLDKLTEREGEILEELADGLSNKEIGLHLHLSEKTIKHYMTNILQKLQVRNRVEAALIAQRACDKSGAT